jgi:hypothetical protein
MRTAFVLVGFLALSPAFAESGRLPAPVPRSEKVLPLKGAAATNSCAAYGPGFVKLEGSRSCVKLGGTVDVGVTASGWR